MSIDKSNVKTFFRAALARAVRTVAQTALATIGTSAVIEEVNWLVVASASVLAGIISVLTSLATGLPEVEEDEILDDDDGGIGFCD